MPRPLISHDWGLEHPVATSAIVTLIFAAVLMPLVLISAPPDKRLLVGLIMAGTLVGFFVIQLNRIRRVRSQERAGVKRSRRWPPQGSERGRTS